MFRKASIPLPKLSGYIIIEFQGRNSLQLISKKKNFCIGYKAGERCCQWHGLARDHVLAELGECSQQDPFEEAQQ